MPDFRYSKNALRALARMAVDQRTRILDAIRRHATDPTAPAEVRKLRGRPGYRLRVGDLPIIFKREKAALRASMPADAARLLKRQGAQE